MFRYFIFCLCFLTSLLRIANAQQSEFLMPQNELKILELSPTFRKNNPEIMKIFEANRNISNEIGNFGKQRFLNEQQIFKSQEKVLDNVFAKKLLNGELGSKFPEVETFQGRKLSLEEFIELYKGNSNIELDFNNTIKHVIGGDSGGPGLQEALKWRTGNQNDLISIRTTSDGTTINVKNEAPFTSPRLGLFANVGLIVDRKHIEKQNDGSYKFIKSIIRTDGKLRIPGSDGTNNDDQFLNICERDEIENTIGENLLSRYTKAPRYMGRACSGFLANKSNTFFTAKHCLLPEFKMNSLRNFFAGSGCLSDTPTQREAMRNIEVTETELASRAIIFGFKLIPNALGEATFPTSFPSDQVYFIDSYQQSNIDNPADFAVITLDRHVPEDIASPLPVDNIQLSTWVQNSIQDNPPLATVGYGLGLPFIRESEDVGVVGIPASSSHSIYVSADTYRGGSGSAVINLRDGKVMGMMICGKLDYNTKVSAGNDACLIPMATQELTKSKERALFLSEALQ